MDENYNLTLCKTVMIMLSIIRYLLHIELWQKTHSIMAFPNAKQHYIADAHIIVVCEIQLALQQPTI